MLVFSVWRVFALISVNGVESTAQTFGIEFLETVGPYVLARCFIRDADDFYNAVKLLFTLVVLILPLALIEFVSGRNVSRDLVSIVCPTIWAAPEQRLGLTRVQSVFDHPILFGVFASSPLALVHLVLGYKKPLLRRNLATGVVAFAAILSLSAGPLMMVVAQALLLSWNALLRNIKSRWKVLAGCLLFAVFLVEVVANRSLPALVSSFLTFDEQSYWYRLVIWHYGSQAALNHPLFGVGLNDWERPSWMGPSIDNFWLYLAIRAGLPAPVLLHLALLCVSIPLATMKINDQRLLSYRTGFLIAISGIYLVSWTVHFWDTAYVVLFFLMGSSAWMRDVKVTEPDALNTLRPASAGFMTVFGARRTRSAPLYR